MIQAYTQSFWRGFKSAISLHNALPPLMFSPVIRNRTGQCVLLNGVIFLGSIALINFAIRPAIRLVASAVRFPGLDGGASGLDAAEQAGTMRWLQDAIVDWIIFVVFQLCWVYPVYLISFVLNMVWYQDIADAAYRYYFPNQRARPTPPKTLIQEEIYRTLVMLGMILQVNVMYLIPHAGMVLTFAYMSWIFSIYCFEYKWFLHGWGLRERLTHFECNWLFYIGFGAPGTLATFFFPGFISSGVFALIFPIYIILAVASEEPREHKAWPQRVPVFGVAKRFSNAILSCLSSLCLSGTKAAAAAAAAGGGGGGGASRGSNGGAGGGRRGR